MKQEKILITGATGFLGWHLASKIRRSYPDARLALTGGHPEKGSGVAELDLTDAEAVGTYLRAEQPDIVYHLGGLVDLTRTYEVALRCIHQNFIGTTNLLEAVSARSPRKFVYVSTEEVYGTDTLPYGEEDKTNPPSPYAITKLASEQMCRIYSQEWGIPTLVLRVGTMYGPRQPDHRYIAQAVIRALKNEPIPINSGLKKRDYVFVEDVADALLLVMERSFNPSFEIINIGGGKAAPLKKLVEKIIDISGSSSALQFGAIPDRISEVNEWRMDIAKAKRLLGWKPQTDLDTGIRKTIAFYKQTT